ncbi:MAG: phage portal protein [Halobacteriota archaeon]|nr:phage portal protein [Halobacteriota archaeon]
MQAPPTWNYQQYLQVYGNTGWLFRGASMIAYAVASEDWTLTKLKSKGEYDEVDSHPVLDLLDIVNPYQTRFEFLYLQTLYLVLVGESFTVLDFKGRQPAQMWSAMPQCMEVKRNNPTDYISNYVYRVGSNEIIFDLNEVIHIKNPNPSNPLRGTGAVASLITDLSVERNASEYQNRLFYNDATPGMMIAFPELPPKPQREELIEEWNDKYQGVHNARRTAFLWGGAKADTVAMTNRELDFWKSTEARAEKILDIIGVPSQLVTGKTSNRSTLEVLKYVFAQYTILPYLTQIREAWNEQLLPLYPDGAKLKLEFTNPVQENREGLVVEVEKMVKSGVYTREEGRTMLGLDEKPAKGGTFLLPMNVTPSPSNAKTKAKSYVEDKETYWKAYAKDTEAQEEPVINAMKAMFGSQEKEALDNLRAGKRDHLIDEVKAYEDYKEAMKPLLGNVLLGSLRSGRALVSPEAPHGKQEEHIPDEALEWIELRIGRAGAEIGEETARLLSSALSTGMEAGESMEDIAKRIQKVFGYCSEVRAMRIARTEVIMAANEGALMGYEASGVVSNVEFFVALDGGQCPVCEGLADQRFPVNRAHGIIPLHANCLLPDVRVEAPLTISGNRVWYDGDAVELITENGHILTVTPNHPILTPFGFMRAKTLRQGDYVISSSVSERIAFAIDPDNNHMPTRIEDVWNTLVMSDGMTTVRMPLSPEDLYSDAGFSDGEIDIVGSDSLLRDKIGNTSIYEKYSKLSLGFRQRMFTCSTFNGGSTLTETSEGDARTSNRCVTCGRELIPLLVGEAGHADNIGLATISRSDVILDEHSADYIPGEIIGFGQSELGFSSSIAFDQIRGSGDDVLNGGDVVFPENSEELSSAYAELADKFLGRFSPLVTADKIINIRRLGYSGHVYDLQTTEELYIAEGVVVKNCRCVWLPEV